MAVKLGEYVLEKRIGKGGMGQVFLARQESLDRLVAVKLLPKELANDKTFRARFEREAKSAAALIHPNVVQIYSYGIEKDVPYFAMEYIEGEDLGAKLARRQKFSIKESLRIVRDVAKALECAHRNNMVHRDIKPSNMMISPDDSIKVMDFGLAKATKVRTSITQKGLIMGTPAYMSPEQGKGEELDVRSDMYSLGIVFYELLTGIVPFEAETPTAVIYQHIYETPRPVRDINPEVPLSLEQIVLKLLAKDPDERYPVPGDLLADLEAFEAGAATIASGRPSSAQAFPETLKIDPTLPETQPIGVTPPTSRVAAFSGAITASFRKVRTAPRALQAGVAGAVAVVVVLIVLLLTVWTGTGETDADTGRLAAAGKEGVLQLSVLRAALPDEVRTVHVRKLGERHEEARDMPIEDVKVSPGTYLLAFKRPGYWTEELKVKVTKTGNIPSLHEAEISFELTPELTSAYTRGKEFVQAAEYARALPELRRLQKVIPQYEDVAELIALCNQHLAYAKEMDEIYELGMKYYRDQQWEKVVETLSKLPEDYEKASQAFSVLTDAREKARNKKLLDKHLADAQRALLTGDLTGADGSATAALAIDGANEAVSLVLKRARRARELLSTAGQAQAREDYQSAVEKLKELVKLTPQSSQIKEHLARMEQALAEQIECSSQIASLLLAARAALAVDEPETSILKLNTLLETLDPDNEKAKTLLVKAHEALTCKLITGRLTEFDRLFATGAASDLTAMIDPEQPKMCAEIKRQMISFFAEKIGVLSITHKDIKIELARDRATVDTVFSYDLVLIEAKRRVSGALKRQIKMVRRADTWYIAAIENLE